MECIGNGMAKVHKKKYEKYNTNKKINATTTASGDDSKYGVMPSKIIPNIAKSSRIAQTLLIQYSCPNTYLFSIKESVKCSRYFSLFFYISHALRLEKVEKFDYYYYYLILFTKSCLFEDPRETR
ncbi:hypothetical protein ACTXT7_007924 [Hymenolepis weldensis]